MLDNNISTMKPNLVGELNLILLNIPENLSPLERERNRQKAYRNNLCPWHRPQEDQLSSVPLHRS